MAVYVLVLLVMSHDAMVGRKMWLYCSALLHCVAAH